MGYGDRKSLPGACGAELCARLDFQRLDFNIQYPACPSLLTAAPPLLTSHPIFFTRVQSTTVASRGLEGTVNLLAFLFFDSSEKNRAWRKVEGPMGAKGSLSVEAGRGAIAPLGAEKGQEASGFKCWLGDL